MHLALVLTTSPQVVGAESSPSSEMLSLLSCRPKDLWGQLSLRTYVSSHAALLASYRSHHLRVRGRFSVLETVRYIWPIAGIDLCFCFCCQIRRRRCANLALRLRIPCNCEPSLGSSLTKKNRSSIVASIYGNGSSPNL